MQSELMRPIVGIENRTAKEVFDIMCDRFRAEFGNEESPRYTTRRLHEEIRKAEERGRQHEREAALSAAEQQTAPSVAGEIADAVLSWMVEYDLLDAGNEYRAAEVIAVLDDFKPSYHAALSAQVQDESEIVDCLSAGKPFVFDPATNFCHADDGGAPEHGIKYVPTAQVQEVSGWQPIETAPRDGTTVLLYAPGWDSPKTGWTYGKDDWQDCPYSHKGSENYLPTHWMPLPAAPAKQEG